MLDCLLFVVCLSFHEAFTILMALHVKKIFILFKKYVIILHDHRASQNKTRMSSAADLWKVSENFNAQVLNCDNNVTNMRHKSYSEFHVHQI